MNHMNVMHDLAGEALKAAQQAGADEVEIFGLSARSIHVDIQLDKIDLARETRIQGLGIKAVVRGAVGFSATNEPDRINEAARAAVSSAGVRDSDPHWSGLARRSKYEVVAGINDQRIAGIDIDTCIDLTARMIEGALSVSGAQPTAGKFTCSSSGYVILNTSGVEVEEHTTKMDGYMECRAGEGGGLSNAYEFEISRNLDIDFFRIGKEAAEQAVASVNGTGIASGETDVLLKPKAVADILESTFLPSLSAENVQKGRSSLTGRLGSQLAADGLDIIDDGRLVGGIGSARSDDEGTPSRTNRIIEKGVLGTYLYDTYTAGKNGVESTGNASRNNYAQTANIDIRNMKLEFPPSDVVSETSRGVMVGSVIGAHTANPISGDFSVEARNSFLIHDGVVERPVKSMMISGNIFRLLQNISGAGRDVKVLGHIITPTIKVSDLKVVG